MKKLFCWIYATWLVKAVDSKSDPAVVIVDALFASGCKYCMIYRSIFFTMGICLSYISFWFLLLPVLSVLCTYGEKYWLCDLEK
jgi:hypothetical protein